MNLRSALVLSLLTGALTAQVLEHQAVVGTIVTGYPMAYSGFTGLYVVPLPTSSSPPLSVPVLVTSLPSQLTVNTATTPYGGMRSVLVLPDGRVVVGGAAVGPSSPEFHVLTLAGTSVTQAISVPAGTLNGVDMSLGGLALLPGNRVLVTMGRSQFYASGPGSASPLGVLDPTSGTLAPIALQGSHAGVLDGCVVTPDGDTAYLTSFTAASNPPCYLYEVDLRPFHANPQAAVPIRTIGTWSSDFVHRPSLSRDGMLYVSGFDLPNVRSTLWEIDTTASPVTMAPRTISPQNVGLVGPAIEPASGQLLFGSVNVNGTIGGPYANAIVMSGKHGGALTILAAEPTAGWGVPVAIAVHPSFERYGLGTPNANSYHVVDCPNPDGLPTIGNANFGITVRGTGASILSALALGFAPAQQVIAGLNVLVSPPLAIQLIAPVGVDSRLALPLPNDPSLSGLELYAQGAHLETAGLAASDAVRITIL